MRIIEARREGDNLNATPFCAGVLDDRFAIFKIRGSEMRFIFISN
jgi:hypothetical protein